MPVAPETPTSPSAVPTSSALPTPMAPPSAECRQATIHLQTKQPLAEQAQRELEEFIKSLHRTERISSPHNPTLYDQLSEKQRTIESKRAEKPQLEQALEEAQQQKRTAEAKPMTLQNQNTIQRMSRQISELQSQLTSLSSEIQTLSKEIEAIDKQLGENTRRASYLRERNNTAQNQLQEAIRAVEEQCEI